MKDPKEIAESLIEGGDNFYFDIEPGECESPDDGLCDVCVRKLKHAIAAAIEVRDKEHAEEIAAWKALGADTPGAMAVVLDAALERGKITLAQRDKLAEALRPFAKMDRPDCELDELACSRGTASDRTLIDSRDFRRAAEALDGVKS
jgi:hypothetical protein